MINGRFETTEKKISEPQATALLNLFKDNWTFKTKIKKYCEIYDI